MIGFIRRMLGWKDKKLATGATPFPDAPKPERVGWSNLNPYIRDALTGLFKHKGFGSAEAMWKGATNAERRSALRMLECIGKAARETRQRMAL